MLNVFFFIAKSISLKKDSVDADLWKYRLVPTRMPLSNAQKRIIEQYHNCYKGRRCFIIGNGPSLNMVDLSKLENEITFGVSGIFLMTEKNGFKPTFYVVEDALFISINLESICTYQHENKFIPSQSRKFLAKFQEVFFIHLISISIVEVLWTFHTIVQEISMLDTRLLISVCS